jgi:hypothetical protein
MGNLITTISAIWSPLITTELIIPFIYYPFRFNNIPFIAPSTLKYMFLYLFINALIIGFFGTIGGIMSSLKECDKMNVWTSINGAKWPVFFSICGLIFLFLFPIIKAPMLALCAFIPYSNLIVTGLYLSVFVFAGGFLGNRYSRLWVCGTT